MGFELLRCLCCYLLIICLSSAFILCGHIAQNIFAQHSKQVCNHPQICGTEDSEVDEAAAVQSVQPQSAMSEQHDQASTSQAAASQLRPMSAAQNSSAGTALYIGNLQWWTTDADLESLCSKYGQILTLKTFEDKTTGKSKGYVMVHFAAPEAAATCQAELNG